MKNILWNSLLIWLLMPLSLSAQKGKQDKPDNNPSNKEGIVADSAEHALLLQLYTQSNGPIWLRKQHWGEGSTQKDMQRWQGINFSQGDVHQLNMPENNLVGTLPESLGELAGLKHIKLNGNKLEGAVPFSLSLLPGLQTLALQYNRLSSFPSFKLSPSLARLKVDVSNNRLDFGDLEPNFSAPGQPIFREFSYLQQDLLAAPDTLFQRERTRLQISLQTGGEHNRYQWQKQTDAGTWQEIAGATEPVLELFPLQLADSGQYRCRVSNTWVPDLILDTHAYTVQVEEYAEVPFVIDGRTFAPGRAYRLQVDTIDVVRLLDSRESFTLINPADTLQALLSLQDLQGNSLGGGYRFRVDPQGFLSELRYLRGMEELELHPALYALDSNQLQLFPVPEAGGQLAPFQLSLEQGLVYRPYNSRGEVRPLRITGLPQQPANYTFQVYDKRGEVVFSTQDPQLFWQGTLSDNSPAAAGVYSYTLSVDGKLIRGQFLLSNH